jgi:hypothetical protein
MHDEYDSHYVRIKKPATARLVGKREVTFTCERCGNQVTEWRYPGPVPQYCAQCGPIVKHEKTAARVRRVRDRQRRGVSTAVPSSRFMVRGTAPNCCVVDTEIAGYQGTPLVVRWFTDDQAAKEYAQELNATRGHAKDEPKCVVCSSQPAGGDPPHCAACWSKLADLHG